MIRKYILNNYKLINDFSKDYIKTIFSHYSNTFLHLIFNLIQIPIFLKIFNNHEFGIILFLISLINFSSIGIGWISSGLIKSFGERSRKNSNNEISKIFYLSKNFTIFYLFLFNFFILVSFFFVDVDEINLQDLFISLLLICLSIIFKLLPNTEIQYLNSIDKQSLPIKIENVRLFILIALLFVFKDKFESIYQIALIICFSIFISYVLIKINVPKKKFYIEKKNISLIYDFKTLLGPRALKYGVLGFFILILQSDIIILNLLSKSEFIKDYVIYWKIPEIIFLIFLKIPATFEPAIIRHEANGNREIIINLHKSYYLLYLFAIFIVSLIYFFCSEYLISIWLGDQIYLNFWFKLFCCVNLFFITSMRWNLAFLHAMAKLSFLIKLIALEAILKVIIIVIFIDKFTFMTPIIATSFCHAVFFFWVYGSMHKKFLT